MRELSSCGFFKLSLTHKTILWQIVIKVVNIIHHRKTIISNVIFLNILGTIRNSIVNSHSKFLLDITES